MGATFEVDDKPHTLVFTCDGDRCQPKNIGIAAGEKDEAVAVELQIVPARLVVNGEPSHSYAIEERLNVSVTPGVATEIPMTQGSEKMHVYDRADPKQTRTEVNLVAGQTRSVTVKKQ